MKALACAPRRVSVTVRTVVTATAAYCAWQVAWIAERSEDHQGRLLQPWTVGTWVVVWALVGLAAVVAALTARDIPARVALGGLFVAQVAAIASTIADHVAIGAQFWEVGEAALIAAYAVAVLVSPMRPIPDPLPPPPEVQEHG